MNGCPNGLIKNIDGKCIKQKKCNYDIEENSMITGKCLKKCLPHLMRNPFTSRCIINPNYAKQKTRTKRVTPKKNSLQTKKKVLRFETPKKSRSLNMSENEKIMNEEENSNYLNIICPKSGDCMAFGMETDRIKKFFNNFINFDLMTSSKQLHYSNASNGLFIEINYSKLGYNAEALLKSNKKITADNLMYEYIVGLFMDRYNKYFPCFLQTYGIYKYKRNPHTRKNKVKLRKNMLDLLAVNRIDRPLYNISCKKSESLAILIQYFKNSFSLAELLDTEYNEEFYNSIMKSNTIFEILFQVYIPLAQMANVFTHYDLHLGNILLYPIDGYIEFRYNYNDGRVITFCSKYIAKIIDYGRSYFNTGTFSSLNYLENLCKEPKCNPDCGSDFGYTILNTSVADKFYGIVPSQVNRSHDLRALYYLREMLKLNPHHNNKLYRMLYRLNYEDKYGTNEVLKLGYKENIINNIFDVSILLERHFTSSNYNTCLGKKIGILNIYVDGERESIFIPV